MKILTLFILNLFLSSISIARSAINIHPSLVEVISKDVTFRESEHMFDDNRDTQSLIYSKERQVVDLVITLPAEYRVDRIEIISDKPSELKQAVHGGYAKDVSELRTSVPYDCEINKTSTICHPPCHSLHNDREGVVGQAILWKLERLSEDGWTRVYDVILNGKSLEELSSLYGRKGDLTFLKPYYMKDGGAESCTDQVWKLTDTSEVSPDMSPVATSGRKITIQFGRASVVHKVAMMFSKQHPIDGDPVLHFGGPSSVTKTINIASDCKTQANTEGMHICDTKDLARYPFSNVSLDVNGLVRLHVYGSPLLYPRIRILTSAKTAEPESQYLIRLNCIARPCKSDVATELITKIHGNIVHSCPRQGEQVQCSNMQLLRVHVNAEGQSVMSDTLLVSDGSIMPEPARVMNEMKVIQSSPNELTVSMPRTHSYFVQYKCRCESNDKVSSQIESVTTNLQPSDFDQDLVFQRNYSAVIEDKVIPARLGFLELPDEPQLSYFRLMISGHSLTDKLHLNVTFLEGGAHATMTGEYAQSSSVMAFPRASNNEFAWPIPAYQVNLQEAYPDAADGEVITVEWSTTEEAFTLKTIIDVLRTLVVSPTHEDVIRAWVWERSTDRLDIRAYYQTSFVEHRPPVEVVLQRSGCSSNGSNERVSFVRIEAGKCSIGDGSAKTLCEKAEAGFAIQFLIDHPSASDSYELERVSDGDISGKQLVKSAAVLQDLKSELDAAEISLKIVSLKYNDNAEATTMEVAVIVASKTIIDNSACRHISITLHPTWPVSELPEHPLKTSETLFDLSVPNDQNLITLDVEIRIDAIGDVQPALSSRRSLTIPNPRFHKIKLSWDSSKEIIEWEPFPVAFRDLLDHFQVKVFRTERVCGIKSEIQSPQVDNDFDGAQMHEIRLSQFNSDLQVEYEIQVTPILKSADNVKSIPGSTSTITLSKGSLGPTVIKKHVQLTIQSARFYVIPSQPASCLQDIPSYTVNFELKLVGEDDPSPNYLAEVKFEPDSNERSSDAGRWFVATKLIQGRRYELKATVHYQNGDQDLPSSAIEFWTPDEIQVTTKEAFVSPGEHAKFSCVGAVGPHGPHRKRLEWRRGDGTPLPDGARTALGAASSETTEQQEKLDLIFDKVEIGQANTYTCFIRPSVNELLGKTFVPPTVKLLVTDLSLDVNSMKADSGESVKVACKSQNDRSLSWISPSGQELGITEHAMDPYVLHIEETRNVVELHIPHVRLEVTGEYVCKDEQTGSSRAFKLRMKDDIQLQASSGTSHKASEKFILNCTSHLGHQKQRIVWYQRSSEASPWVPLASIVEKYPSAVLKTENGDDNIRYSIFSWVNSPSSNGQFGCALEDAEEVEIAPDVVTTKMELGAQSAVSKMQIEPVITMEKPVWSAPNEVTIKCAGHPSEESHRLNWYFLSHGASEEEAIPIEPGLQASLSADSELLDQIRKSLHLGDYTPALWPGASGPMLLAASGKISTREVGSGYSTPEILELIVKGPLNEELKSGSLLCNYRRLDGSMVAGLSVMGAPEQSGEQFSKVQKKIDVNDIANELSDKPKEHVLGPASKEGKTDVACEKPFSGWLTMIMAISLLVYHL